MKPAEGQPAFKVTTWPGGSRTRQARDPPENCILQGATWKRCCMKTLFPVLAPRPGLWNGSDGCRRDKRRDGQVDDREGHKSEEPLGGTVNNVGISWNPHTLQSKVCWSRCPHPLPCRRYLRGSRLAVSGPEDQVFQRKARLLRSRVWATLTEPGASSRTSEAEEGRTEEVETECRENHSTTKSAP